MRQELRFLGFAIFYQQFIKSFSTLAQPLMDVLRGQAKRLKWHPEADRVFERLKTAFSTPPMLQQPDPDKTFVVEVDASDVGVGVVLFQYRGKAGKLRPFAYFSKKLCPERYYGVGDWELLAMKLAFEEWRHWLEGMTLIHGGDGPQKLVISAKKLNVRQARWSLFFPRFRFRVTYRPGERNVRADILSK
ncbi:hypothetical protein P4O66_003812 [Electrophorus voltai]|uniref:Reverse transcriptase/retrotransposon-derived protein RNase H-like domain-containing protein n=1 Tax=Electrophorus voltai TaxID=2609070 RepID=A0AAD9E3M7_9TELE|nr:hypothetical protein P4O66_003812 [Electrophorus voltai]